MWIILVDKKMPYLVLVRHGQSLWNLKNIFTGWRDIDLSPFGRKEAKRAGEILKKKGFEFDIAYTSVLIRAISTLDIILKTMRHKKIPIRKNKAINERDYGSLVGMNKDEARKKFGVEQVHIWRRSYDIAPPGGESLKDTAERTLPYFTKYIMADIKKGNNVLVSAHGNSLRSIVMKLDKLTKEQVVRLEIPTGIPIVYEFDKGGRIISKANFSKYC